MAKAQIKLNLKGFRTIRTSPEATAFVKREAEAVARRAGPGFEVFEAPSKNRARFTVRPVTSEAIARNARDNVLVKALRG